MAFRPISPQRSPITDEISNSSEIENTKNLIETAESKVSYTKMLSPEVESAPLIESWTCNWPVSMVEDPTDISTCSTQLVILKDELQLATWNDNEFVVAVMKSAWSLVLHAYTGTGKICFGYISPTEPTHIFSCNLSHIRTPTQLIKLAQESQNRRIFPLSCIGLEKSVCNTALSVQTEDPASITKVSGEPSKQVSD